MKEKMRRLALCSSAVVIAISLVLAIAPAVKAGAKDIWTDTYIYLAGGKNVEAKRYVHPPGYPDFRSRAKFIGELSGSWYEMGVQYGERVPAELIQAVFDGWLLTWYPQYEDPPFDYLKESLLKYEEQVSYFAPELLEMLKGVADGAAGKLQKARYAQWFTPYEQVKFINWHTSVVWRHPWPNNAKVSQSGKTIRAAMKSEEAYPLEGCSAFAAGPGATLGDGAFAAQNCDIDFFPWSYLIAYIANPDDPKAHRWWSLCSAGQLIGIHAINDKGVSASHNTGSDRTVKDRAFGVPWTYRILHPVIFCDNKDSAVEMITVGTPEYRAKTGRKTLLRDGNTINIVADRESCAVVENTARWYAVRNPGDMGEIGNYIVATNHYVTTEGAYDEDDVRHDEGMADIFGESEYPNGSVRRYLTLMWRCKYNYGKIDDEMTRRFMSGHFFVNEDGERVDQVWDEDYGWIPSQYAPGSPVQCRHGGGYPEQYTGSTGHSKVGALAENTMYWTLGRPCEHVGPWSSVQWRD